MDAKVISDQYELNVKLLNNALKNIDDDEAHLRMNDNTNNVVWLVGHSLFIQYSLANVLGITSYNPYVGQFRNKSLDITEKYPLLEKMLADWNNLAPRIVSALKEINSEQLAQPLPFQLPYNDQTVKGLLGFQMHHLGYTIGQIGLYRKFLSKESLSYE